MDKELRALERIVRDTAGLSDAGKDWLASRLAARELHGRVTARRSSATGGTR